MEIRVLGFGDNVVDKYEHEGIMYPGGNSVNFAVYASQMGVSGTYCGVFADDTEAELIRDALERQGVDYSHSTFLHAGETGKGRKASHGRYSSIFRGDGGCSLYGAAIPFVLFFKAACDILHRAHSD